MPGLPTFVRNLTLPFQSEAADTPVGWRNFRLSAALAVALWVTSMLLVAAVGEGELFLYWGILGPCTIGLFFYAQHALIPAAQQRPQPFGSYLARVLLVVLIAVLPIALVLQLITRDTDIAVGFNIFQVFFHLLLTAPLAWLVYRRRQRSQAALEGLQQELGQSTATLDLLRAQINPHFLFNALNTLYGTALQENSERTAQGIQMLGDMMRFMLHENHQPRILLAREIEYLRNYVELQSLRIATSPGISIETAIEDVPDSSWIAPMLLIPFVENAFKHGISLKHKSWIKATLHYEQNTLYFDVYNSLHARPEQPERPQEHAGIGLANVQQRLILLYPDRHELVIRQTVNEYFVHLTLHL